MAITKASGNSVTAAAKGDLVVGSATNDSAILAVGTNDYVLTAASGETTGLKWAAPAGGGKVLQVVQATRTTLLNVTGTSYSDVLSASITPSAATSKVLLMISNPQRTIPSSATTAQGIWNIVRASTSIVADFTATGHVWGDSGNYGTWSVFSFNYLDSPNTTSSTTYKFQVKGDGANTTIQNNYSGATDGTTLILMEIGA